MTTADDQLRVEDFGTVEYLVAGGKVYEPQKDSYDGDLYFVCRGEFDGDGRDRDGQPMNRAMWLSEKLESSHDGMMKMWVWGLTLIVTMLFAIVFNELHTMGQITTEAAEGLVIPFGLIVAAAAVGCGTYVSSMLFGLIGCYIEERDVEC